MILIEEHENHRRVATVDPQFDLSINRIVLRIKKALQIKEDTNWVEVPESYLLPTDEVIIDGDLYLTYISKTVGEIGGTALSDNVYGLIKAQVEDYLIEGGYINGTRI